MVPGDGMIAPGTGIVPGAMATPTGELQGTPTKNKSKNGDNKEQGMQSSTKATLVVEVPDNAKLFIDDMPVNVPAGVQTFDTPALSPGRAYYYMVRIEAKQDGKPVSRTQLIIVRAGQVARAEFKERESETVTTAQAK